MTEQEVLDSLRRLGVVITGGHFVYTSGMHGSDYVNKDMVYPHVQSTSRLCRAIAEHFRDESLYSINAVVAPAIGGVILCTWTAYWLEQLTGRKALALYAEKAGDNETFIFRRGYDRLIPGRRILAVDDVLNTGESARQVVEATRALGGTILGLGALWNRGGVTPQDVADVPELFALVNVQLDKWDEADCPLCAQGVPINTGVGQGNKYLARKRAS